MQTTDSTPLLDMAALAAAPLQEAPYRHLMVPHFLPEAALARVYADLPKLERGGSFPPEALHLGPTARALMAEMQGPAMKRAIGERLGLALDDAPTMLTMRVYCRDKDGQIHTDSLAKRVTILLYLNPDIEAFRQQEGCLRLLHSADDLEDFAVEVPPTNGTLLVFPNGPTTWHGHRAYVGPRFSVQLNYMTNDSKARSELRRHKLSAFLKRLTPAA
ncbi:MAG TPA: 2OG-Fe(II) oxygenase [Acetobacteraceae bacterium]|nr:2OG-Fe(II) oxygenase [Acetobacteraceae bacterium]